VKLPNGDQGEIPLQKLTNYCLNPEHSTGKHKARVFQSALGITRDNPHLLRYLIQRAAIEGEVIQQSPTAYGQLFKVDWTIPDTNGLELRTLWEITVENPNPRLVSAFIK
jgi:hypothetical protein